MKLRITTLFAFLLFCAATQGQDTIIGLSSNILISKGIKHLEKSDYDVAKRSFESVHAGDSNYHMAQIYLARTHVKAKNYAAAILISKNGIQQLQPFSSELYVILSQSLMQINTVKEAISVLTQGIAIFPTNAELPYTRALAYTLMEQHQESITDLKTSIKLNPYSANPHLKLGEYAKKSGEIAKAMMCYNTYFLLSDTYHSDDLIKYNSYVVSEGTSTLQDVTLSSDDYSNINSALKSKKSLSKKFKTPSKLKSPLVKQNYQLLELLNSHKLSTGFWDEVYAPFYIQLWKEGLFNAWVYSIQRNSDSRKVISGLSKNQLVIAKFRKQAMQEWKKHHSEYLELFNGKFENVHYYWSAQNTITGKGIVIAQEPVGKFYYYYPSGMLSSFGLFDIDGEKSGEWTFYHANGNIAELTTYTEGDIVGLVSSFYINGQKKSTTPYLDGQPNGTQINYYCDGIIQRKTSYSNGIIHGESQSYSRIGTLARRTNYKHENLDGPAIEYFSTGEVRNTSFFSNGVPKDSSITFTRDGKVKFFSVYKNGQVLTSTATEKNSDLEVKNGWWTFYTASHTVIASNYYVNGVMNGPQQYYLENGSLARQDQYDMGVRMGFTVFDSLAHLTDSVMFTPDSSRYMQKNADGIIEKSFTLKGMVLHGPAVQYYPSGIIESQGEYWNGNKNGVWKSYHTNGQQAIQGNYFYGTKTGNWTYHLPDGLLLKEEKHSISMPLTGVDRH
ncbi:MAG: antitoxin component YwqK of YwqJK toxin-antitoxin module [Salibacteraceae bacterium]|jgi:antitoxin component YwqK of YwqJK toxin-antitoxin module